MQSRYYNPTWGRFLNADAFATTGQGLLGSNMFAYCLNNPVRYVDYSGMYTIEPEIKINGFVYTLEAQKTTVWGTFTLKIVIDISVFKAYSAKAKDFEVEMDGNSLEITAPDGQALSFNLSSNGIEADSHTIRMIQSGKSSVNMAISKDGYGLCYSAETDGVAYDVTLSYNPNLLGAIINKIGKTFDKAASAYSPGPMSAAGGWKATSRYTNLAFAARCGGDLFDPITCLISR